MIKVGIVGYGTVGKRVADAVMAQDDMQLVGATVNSYNARIFAAAQKGIPLYTIKANKTELEKSEVAIAGDFDAFLKAVDVVVDATPKQQGNLAKYKAAGVKAILQGGENDGEFEASFVAECNYENSLNKDAVRVVSCGTTGLSRTLNALKPLAMGRINVTILRRSLDPDNEGKTMLNSIMPTFPIPSHHGHDVQTILPEIDIHTIAYKVPTTLMHLHSLAIELKEATTAEKVKGLLQQSSRIFLIPKEIRVKSTAHLLELGKDLGMSRGDFMAAPIWEESIKVDEKYLYLTLGIHQESIIIPENIDCIRAVMGEQDAASSITKTNRSLGL